MSLGLGVRWLRFNAVGVPGFLVQVGVVSLLVEHGVHYLAATVIALEAAILHNFLWHSRWTWRDRAGAGWPRRLGRFNAIHGATAMLNLACMAVLVDGAGLPYLLATCLSVGACSVLNFTACHTTVFKPSRA